MTKKLLTEICRQILHSTRGEVSDSDRDFLIGLLQHHPDLSTWPIEQQGHVEKITVALADSTRYSTPCFYLHYENGEVWLFSFHKCIRNMTGEQVKDLLTQWP